MNNLDSYIFTPGPVKMAPYILDIGARQTPYFRNAWFSEVYRDCERILLAMAGAPASSRVVFFASSGTGAMEATVINLLNRKDRALAINGGGFGQRFLDICRYHDIPVAEHKVDGDNLSNTDVLKAYAGTSTLLVNAHETTTGVLYDLDAIGGYCHRHNMLHIVDAISMFVTDEVNMIDQCIDALIISSHKGLALPPGMSMVILSPKAQARIGHATSYYFDFRRALDDGARGQTPFTPAVTIMLQLHARLQQIARDTVQHEIDKAKGIANYFREHVAAWPLEFFSRFMPNAMTALKTTDGQSALDIVEMLSARHNVVVAPCGGALQDVVFRVSHMGDMTKDYVDVLIGALDQLYGVKR
jgi:aspartate aminotransferase-like enzyme